MMRSCRSSRGFTLLELLVVLVILGLVAGLSLPALSRLYDGMNISLQEESVLTQFVRLGERAKREGRAITVSVLPQQGAPVLVELPPGWTLKAEPALHFLESGVCSGGRLVLERGAVRRPFRLAPPFCEPIPE